MANEFIIKNGFYSQGNSAVTGSLIISASGTTNDLLVGTNKLFVSASGNVGIGITTPSASLHINNITTNNSFLVEDSTNPDATPFVIDSSGSVGIGIASTDPSFISTTKLQVYTSGSLQRALRIRETTTSSSFNFWAITSSAGTRILRLDQDTTGTNVMTWAQTGEVGIGITTPSAKLHINNTTPSASFLVEDSTNPDSTPFIIDSTGNTMIGTTSSFGLLTVKGSGVTGAVIDTDTSSDTQSTRLFFKISGSGLDASIRNSNGNLLIATRATANASSGTTAVSISGSGDVGIGPGFAPSGNRGAVLQVSGNISIESGDAYKQDGQNVIYIAKGTDTIYSSTIGGAGAGTTGSVLFRQTVYGYQAGALQSSSYQTAMGYQAGYGNIRDYQTTYGYRAGYSTTASYQTAIGGFAGREGSTSLQTAIGWSAGEFHRGDNQTAVGAFAGRFATGSNQTAVGYNAGAYNSGSDNTNIGYFAGYLITAGTINSQSAQSVFLGSQTTAGGANRTNQIVIGYNASGIGSNSVVLGNSSILTTALRGFVGIGTTTPTASLHVNNTTTSASLLIEDSTNPDTTPFIINAIGNVGIGTTTPAAKLHLYHDTYELLLIERSGSLNAPIQYTNAVGTMYAGLSSNAKFTIGPNADLANNSTAVLTVSASGNVGIGTTTPSARLDVNGNTIITGSLTITNDLIVQGSSSIQYITSSQLNIGDNIISVNTINPSVRFGGLSVIDSGSSPQQSGSLLFDSQNNQWIFVHQSAAAAAVTSSVLIMGPQTFNNVGNETTLTANRLTKANAGDLGEHIGDSNITDTGTLVSINSNTEITGSTNIKNGSAQVIVDSATWSELKYGDGNYFRAQGDQAIVAGPLIRLFNGSQETLRVTGSNVSIGTTVTSPTARLHINNTSSANSFLVEDDSNVDVSPFVIDNLGKVGIGLDNPSSPLHVRNIAIPGDSEIIAQFDVSDDSSYFRVSNATGANSTFIPSLQGYNSSDKIALYLFGNGVTDTGTEPLLNHDVRIGGGEVVTRPLYRWSNFGNIKMQMLANGNLGIGTTSPTTKLEVDGTYKLGPAGGILFGSYGAGTNLDMTVLNTGGWVGASKISTSDSNGTVFFGAYGLDTSLISSHWTIGSSSSNAGQELTAGIHLLKNGNVGIGTTSPNARLDVSGNTIISGSLTIIQTGSGNAFAVIDEIPEFSPFIIDSSGSVGMGYSTPSSLNTKLYVSPTISGFIGITANGFNNYGIKGTSVTSNKAAIYGEHVVDALGIGIGVHGKSSYNESPFNGQEWIGGKFEAVGDLNYGNSYSVQLQDGTEAAGKVLVSQNSSGSANWSTRLSGSYEITGSLTVTGELGGTAGNVDMNVLIQSSLLYLSNNF